MGKVFKFGDHIDTDAIVPGKFLNLTDPEALAGVCMEGYESGFASRIVPGDIFVAGENFGCGSSREHAPISIKAAGVRCIIACSFARIFYRSAINIGLPLLESREAAARIRQGDVCEISLAEGKITDITTGEDFYAGVYPEQIQEIIDRGGMIEYVKARTSGHK